MRLIKSSGFTLMELMITVVIIAILAAIAYPNYTSYVMKTRRSDATKSLVQAAALEEQFFTQNNQYSNVFGGGPGAIGAGTGLNFPGAANNATNTTPSIDGYYTLAVSYINANNATFTITATPAAGSPQVNDTQCSQFMIDYTGAKTASSSSSASTTSICWGQ